uniref:Cytochrome c oxidase subunit 2 n=1 Tax=Appalachioria falcifera TaxID=382869 RepID=S4SZI3_APPFA|nr:cytochrome c oxidase subunit II [Appalachioria falcifera]AFR77029.1 cytochrome c oxidase subunit II [Appalachioria falcifera]
MATWGGLLFQDSVSPLMEQLIFFHDHALLILLLITSLVIYMIYMLMSNMMLNRFLLEGQEIEIIWTVFPAVVLIFIAFPSLRLLYLLDEVSSPGLTLSVLGHQWYWSYEYSDFGDLEFDSYMSADDGVGDFRLLDVDNRIVLPAGCMVRSLISSVDVIHSWAVPGLGVKLDAVPGRLNQSSFFIERVGLWFGQCSEICGANHSFMPIVIESVSGSGFMIWLGGLL